MNQFVKVSIIITTKNSSLTLNDLLVSIKKQTYLNKEIIVVDNGSTDQTINIAKKYTNLVYQRGPERSAQRNFGATKATGDFLLFLDSDMILTKKVISECIKSFKRYTFNKNQLGGIIIPEKSFGVGIWAKAKILERNLNSREVYFEAARFFPKKVFWEFDGYDKNLTGPEDWDLPQRIAKKYNIKRIRSFILHNEGLLSLFTLVKKKYYYGLSTHKYLAKHKLPLISSKTIYFMRSGFYKNKKKLLSSPATTLTMLVMLFFETTAGGLGYLKGRFKNEG